MPGHDSSSAPATHCQRKQLLFGAVRAVAETVHLVGCGAFVMLSVVKQERGREEEREREKYIQRQKVLPSFQTDPLSWHAGLLPMHHSCPVNAVL